MQDNYDDETERTAAVDNVGGFMTALASQREKRALDKRAVGRRYGNVHPRTVKRRQDRGEIPSPDFYQGHFGYWWESTLEAHDEAVAREERARREAEGAVNGNRADQGGAASAGRKSVGCTSIPAQRRAVKAIPVDDVEQIARGWKGDSSWNSGALTLCEDVAFALRRKVPALSGIPLLEVEGIVKDTVHQQIEDALRDVISCAVEAIIDVQQDMIETPHEPRRR